MAAHVRVLAVVVACAASFFLATGCSEGVVPIHEVIRSDSSGVELVETRGEAWSTGQPWIVADEPSLTIGLVEGPDPFLFGSIAGVVRLDDGTIVVGDGQARRIRFFDPTGEFLRDMGAPGEGPGEFSSLHALWKCGGERIYTDIRERRRVSVWNGSTGLEREFDLHEPNTDGGRGPFRWTCSPDGNLIASGWGDPLVPNPGVSEFFQQRAPVWILDSTGEVALELGEFMVAERAAVFSGPGGTVGPHPLGRTLSFAMDEQHIYLGPGARLEVLVYDRLGQLDRILRGPSLDLGIPQDIRSEYQASGVPDAEILERIEAAEIDGPASLPALIDLKVDPDGNLWLKRFSFPWEDSELWAVFAADGEFLGHIEMPDRFTVHEIARDYVLGVTVDDFDVERVSLHRLIRSDQLLNQGEW